jgi:hypothetical protein
MSGLRSIYEPVEVYLAAVGNKEPLACRIESGAEMKSWEREALACYLRGELIPPKRGRGQSVISYLDDTEAHQKKRDLENAAVLYHQIMRQINLETGSVYRKREAVLQCVAKHFGLKESDTLNNYLRRSLKATAEIKDSSNITIELFHKWLHRTGRLPEYGKRITALMWLFIKSQRGPRHR